MAKTAVKSDNKTLTKVEAKPEVSKSNKTSAEIKPVSVKKETKKDANDSKKTEIETKKVSLS